MNAHKVNAPRIPSGSRRRAALGTPLPTHLSVTPPPPKGDRCRRRRFPVEEGVPPRSQGPGRQVLRNCTRTSVCGVCVLHPPYSLWDHLWLPGLGRSSAPSWIHTAVHCVWNVLVCIFCLHVSKSFCESSKSTSGLGSGDLDSVIASFQGLLFPELLFLSICLLGRRHLPGSLRSRGFPRCLARLHPGKLHWSGGFSDKSFLLLYKKTSVKHA